MNGNLAVNQQPAKTLQLQIMKDTRAAVLFSLKQLISANLLTKKEFDQKVEALDRIVKNAKSNEVLSFETVMEEIGISQM